MTSSLRNGPTPLLYRNVNLPLDEGFAVVERPNGFLEETILSRVDSFKEVTFLTMRSATG